MSGLIPSTKFPFSPPAGDADKLAGWSLESINPSVEDYTTSTHLRFGRYVSIHVCNASKISDSRGQATRRHLISDVNDRTAETGLDRDPVDVELVFAGSTDLSASMEALSLENYSATA